MFKAVAFKAWNNNTNEFEYLLEDSEFGVIQTSVIGVSDWFEVAIIIATEYSKRNLDVGKNLAVFVILHCKEFAFRKTTGMCYAQDRCCPKFVPNWKTYAASRDEWLQRLLILQ